MEAVGLLRNVGSLLPDYKDHIPEESNFYTQFRENLKTPSHSCTSSGNAPHLFSVKHILRILVEVQAVMMTLVMGFLRSLRQCIFIVLCTCDQFVPYYIWERIFVSQTGKNLTLLRAEHLHWMLYKAKIKQERKDEFMNCDMEHKHIGYIRCLIFYV
jgi:hypothetical protein